MPLQSAQVNLWKSCKVSYLQLHSYSTWIMTGLLCATATDRQYGASSRVF